MRKSVMPSFAKNIRSISGRRRLATVAATVVLAGSVQLMTAESSWACGDMRLGGPHPAMNDANVTEMAPDAAFVSGKSTVVADGNWNEVAIKVTNKTGTDAHGMLPTFGIHTAGDGASLRTQDVRIQVQENGTWKAVPAIPGCYHTVDAGYEQRQRLDNGSTLTIKFRYSIAATSPKGVNELELVTDAWRQGAMGNGATDSKTVNVTRTQDAPAAKPTTTAKPTATAKPTTTAKPATKPAPAKPVEDKTPAPAAPATKAPAAATPSTPSTAPATTAPAGTPELARTGSSSTNGFLAASAAAFVALGAGALIAVRRLRPQR